MFNSIRGQLLAVALICLVGSVTSLPVTPATEVAQTTTTRWQAQPETRWNHADYVLSETEYQQLLDRLQREAQDSVLANPGNYVDRDVDIEEIIRLIEISDANNRSSTTETAENLRLVSTDEPGEALEITGQLETSSTNPVDLDSQDARIQSTRECPICLEPIEPDDILVDLKCNHQFHSECIVHWSQQVSVLALLIHTSPISIDKPNNMNGPHP